MKDVLCSEVQAIVALTLLKNEKNVTVMTFTDDRCQLKPVAWTADMTFEKAMEIYESEIVRILSSEYIQLTSSSAIFRKPLRR